MEAAGGILLVAAAVLAIVPANSPAGPLYTTLLDAPVAIQAGALVIAKPLILWINDGLTAIRAGIGSLSEGATWLQFYGMALLTGIGFTMSLFIGGLAFQGEGYSAAVQVGVLTGSILTAVLGYLVLHLASRSGAAASPAAIMREAMAEARD
jgi:NhaA family Na+:H+ antiporter